MKRLLLKNLWFSKVFDPNTPNYLYYDEESEHFEIGCRTQAGRHIWEFTDEEIEQMQKDYDLSYFTIVDE